MGDLGLPRGTDAPLPGDVVAVLMTEEMARRFEGRREDDVPTYIIEVSDA